MAEGFKVIREGSAAVLFRAGGDAFYNKVQVLNRDLSISVIAAWDARRRAGAFRDRLCVGAVCAWALCVRVVVRAPRPTSPLLC